MPQFSFDSWTIVGFFGQIIFFLRFVVQWIASERAKRSIIPAAFWYISIIGTLVLSLYAWKREDIVFFLGSTLNLIIYFRNLALIKKQTPV